MGLSESEIFDYLASIGIDPEILASALCVGGDEYDVGFETLEAAFNETSILEVLEDNGLLPTGAVYISPADMGYTDSPTDVIPYFYVTIVL